MKKVVSIIVLTLAFCYASYSQINVAPDNIAVYSGSSEEKIITCSVTTTGIIANYLWQKKTISTDWTVVPLNNDTLKLSGLTDDCYYRCIVTIGNWIIDQYVYLPYYSDTVTVDVLPAFNPGTINSDPMVCFGDQAAFVFTTAPDGGDGSYTYQWQSAKSIILSPFILSGDLKSTDDLIPVDPIFKTWFNISGATSNTCVIPKITSNRRYRCLVDGGAGNVSSNEFTIILDTVKADFTPDNASIIAGGSVQFISSCTNTTSYKWDFGNGMTSTEKNPSTFYYTAGAQDVQLIAISPDGCPDTLLMDSAVVVTEELGVADYYSGSGPSIFPQPAANQLYFNLNDASEATITIYLVSGQKVMEQKVANNASIDISALPSGAYITHIDCNDGKRYIRKIIKE